MTICVGIVFFSLKTFSNYSWSFLLKWLIFMQMKHICRNKDVYLNILYNSMCLCRVIWRMHPTWPKGHEDATLFKLIWASSTQYDVSHSNASYLKCICQSRPNSLILVYCKHDIYQCSCLEVYIDEVCTHCHWRTMEQFLVDNLKSCIIPDFDDKI